MAKHLKGSTIGVCCIMLTPTFIDMHVSLDMWMLTHAHFFPMIF